MAYEVMSSKELAVIIGVVLPGTTREQLDEQLDELEFLADTAGAEVIGRMSQVRSDVDPATFIGRGKAEDIVNQARELRCSLAIFNDELSPTHIKNIQKLAGEDLKILDRTGLILDIFHRHAQTKEAQTQVELARLQYMLPRLTRMWTHLERQMGGIGTRGGPGETQIEIDRRLIQQQISKLKKDLAKISRQRETQSLSRRQEFRVALVGYTNAGKSTLLNALTGADVYIQDQLFATLDTTIRKLELESGKKILLSDTVGFIRKLPHDLVASFRSTLKEAADANLLLKVLDASSPQIDAHHTTINNVLRRLDLEQIPSQVVMNKIDLVEDPAVITGLRQKYPDAVFLSAARKLKLNSLTERIEEYLQQTQKRHVFQVPYDRSGVQSSIYNLLTVIERKDTDWFIELACEGNPGDIDKIIRMLEK